MMVALLVLAFASLVFWLVFFDSSSSDLRPAGELSSASLLFICCLFS